MGYKGAWWYNGYHLSNLNGFYLPGQNNDRGVVWYRWKYSYVAEKRSEMKIRPKDF